MFKTAIVGYKKTLPQNTKPRDKKEHQYLMDLINSHDLGQVHFLDVEEIAQKIPELNPFIVMVFSEDIAGQVKNISPNNFLYVIYSPRSIFYRKAEFEKRDKEQRSKFSEMSWIAEQINKANEKEIETLRKVAGMTYKDKYEMIQRAFISDNKELSTKAWEALHNNENSEMVWMRANLIVDAWQHSDAKRMEEFLVMAMQDHVEMGSARQMDNFIDSEGIEYLQFQFLYPDRTDSKYIRRIPLAKNMEKYGYINLLEKYETPNGPQVLMEVGHVRQHYQV